jgi:hypothetical protein
MNAFASPHHTIDLVEELRLRRWARANHVSPQDRDPCWHPVILDEMSRKDAELEELQPSCRFAGFAPLGEPRPAFHPPHRASGPRFLASPQRSGELHYT